MMNLSPSPSTRVDTPKQEVEKRVAIEGFQQEALDLAQEIKTLHQLCATIQGDDDIDPHLLPLVEAALTTYGVSAEEALSDDELLQMLKINLTSEKEKNIVSDIGLRLAEMKGQVPLRTALNTIRSEFAGRIDEETDAVLSNYEALLAPDFITDEKERIEVERLFWTTGATDFSADGFDGFIDTIEQQPDTVISQETKQKIRERFPKKGTPKTGADLLRSIQTTDHKGKPAHHSPETAIQLDSGIRTYINEHGETVMTLPNQQNIPGMTQTISPENLRSGETLAQHINTSIARELVAENFHSMIGLFGGTSNEGTINGHYHEKTMRNAQYFIDALLGERAGYQLLTKGDIAKLTLALQALADPSNNNQAEDKENLTHLGVYRDGEIQWKELESAGRILRENGYYQTHALVDRSAPHRLLHENLNTQPSTARAA